MDVESFEEAFWELEHIRIVVRADRDEEIANDYDFKRALENGKTVTDLKRLRIEPCLENLEYELYDGSFDQPHGRTKLGTVRDSYED
ncbi:hypothetical protein [Bilophila wadsworthia]|uniref:hypothetical protein n=1 Tax=Bilophila wadsworthia TaxID=35833 RepID=UPI0012DE5376|nr:hypothetical protein [Bilophila wadsworthia]